MASNLEAGFTIQSDYQAGYDSCQEALLQSYQTAFEIDDPEFKVDGIEFIENSIRVAFIRKVYTTLMVQLLFTLGFVAVFILSEDLKLWTSQNFWLVYVTLIITLVMILVMIFFDETRRKPPGNYICLAVFTIAEGLLLGSISTSFHVDIVILTVGIICVTCLFLTIFSFQTKFDLTIIRTILILSLFSFVLCVVLTHLLPEDRFSFFNIVCACIGALIFSLYLIYNTQLMTFGKHKYSISSGEYLFAVLNIYLDIVIMCIQMLPKLDVRSN